ncbi:MAG: fumarate hydratase, partial [Aeromonas sp.]
MSIIKKQDFIDSIADALQYISYYHPLDFVQAVKAAYDREANPAAKDALAQILINSRMSAEGHRPLCQDTGIVTCFVKIGMQVQWDSDMTVQQMVDEGTRRAYTHPDNPLRASVLADPAGSRTNTKDNTPAVVHIEMIAGNK